MSKRGFTLIELLVVISIIGTLSSIVLSSVSTARDKGRDAAIKQDLSQMPTAGELTRLEPTDLGGGWSNFSYKFEYGNICSTTQSTGNDGGSIFRDAASKSDHTLNSAVCSTYSEVSPPYPAVPVVLASKYAIDASGNLVHSNSGSPGPPNTKSWWAAAVKLSTGEYYCIDELGVPTTTPGLTIGVTDWTC